MSPESSFKWYIRNAYIETPMTPPPTWGMPCLFLFFRPCLPPLEQGGGWLPPRDIFLCHFLRRFAIFVAQLFYPTKFESRLLSMLHSRTPASDGRLQ